MKALLDLLRRLFGPRAAPPAPIAPLAVPVVAIGDDPWPKPEDLVRILALAECAEPERWRDALHPHLAPRDINTPQRLAFFLATVMHESLGGARLVESLLYTTPDRICRVWPSRFPTLASAEPFVRNPEALANRVYQGRMGNGGEATGDGWRFRGRGLIQLTGRENYARAARVFGRPLDDAFLAWCETPAGAAATSCWWWQAHGCNALADVGDSTGLRERVNGGLNGLADVLRREAKLRGPLELIG